MSLHFETSAEAKEKIRRDNKKSQIFAFFFSIVMFTGILGILFAISIVIKSTKKDDIIAYEDASNNEQEIIEPEEVSESPPSSSSKASQVIASVIPTKISVPNPDVITNTSAVAFGSDFGDFGFGNGGSGFGGGDSGGGKFRAIPSSMRQRCSKEERIARIKQLGGNEKIETVVEKTLQWLKNKQNSDGSWGSGHEKTGLNGLALLTFLGRCETPRSLVYGKTVEKCINYFLTLSQKNNGFITPSMKDRHIAYHHGIATYALCEAYTLIQAEQSTEIPGLKEAVVRAVQLILLKHGDTGSWNYHYAKKGGGDNSLGCWHLQALKAAKHTGLESDKTFTIQEGSFIKKSLDYIKRCQQSDGGVGYSRAYRRANLTGAALLCHQQWGKRTGSFNTRARKWIKNNITKFDYDRKESDLYSHYYFAQAMMELGGNEWRNYNKMMRDNLLKAQDSDGSWPAVGKLEKSSGLLQAKLTGNNINSQLYRGTLATLTLETYYRYLPTNKK